MKSKIVYFLLSLLSTLSLTVVTEGQKSNEPKIQRTFEISFSKRSYVLFEPITIHFKAILPRTDLPPRFRDDSVIKIMLEGSPDQLSELSPFTASPPISGFVPKPAFLGPTTTYEFDFNIYRLEDRFPAAGNYRVQILLRKRDGQLKSNIVEIKVNEPSGLDKEAFEYLNQFEKPTKFDWALQKENGLKLLEDFVKRYGNTVYADEAKYQLAYRYFALREYLKSKLLFESLATSSNPIIRSNVQDKLRDVESNRASDERLKSKIEQP